MTDADAASPLNVPPLGTSSRPHEEKREGTGSLRYKVMPTLLFFFCFFWGLGLKVIQVKTTPPHKVTPAPFVCKKARVGGVNFKSRGAASAGQSEATDHPNRGGVAERRTIEVHRPCLCESGGGACRPVFTSLSSRPRAQPARPSVCLRPTPAWSAYSKVCDAACPSS